MNIGVQLKKVRIEHNISQKELAAFLNVTDSAISMWEKGLRYPSFECFVKILDFFQISADILLDSDRTLSPAEYKSNIEIDHNTKIILDTFLNLNEDNRYILIGEGKKLLKSQKHEEKRKSSTTAKAI